MQSDDAKYWKKELSTELENDLSLSCQSPLADVDLTPDLLDMTASVHERKEGFSCSPLPCFFGLHRSVVVRQKAGAFYVRIFVERCLWWSKALAAL